MLSKKINVLYDISTLGFSINNTISRTGIFRVIENLLFGLIQKNELNVVPTTFSFNFNDVLLYLNNNIDKLDYIVENIPGKIIKIKKNIDDLKNIINIKNNESYFKILRKISCIYYDYLLEKIKKSPRIIFKYYSNNIDIIHSPVSYISYYLDKKRYKRVITVYDLIPIFYPEYFNHDKDHWLFKVIKSIKKDYYITAISESTKNDLCNYRKDLDPARVIVTPLAASEYFYKCEDRNIINEIKTKYNIPNGAEYILSLCTLEPRKNIQTAIKAFVGLQEQEKIKDLYLVLTGTKGWEFDKIFDEIDNAKEIKEKMIITGYVPDEDLAPLYSGAIVFVYPSYYEGFGLPPLEAMQCGTPVVSSNTSSLPEVIGDAGIMINPDDKDGLSEHILKIYKSETLRNEYREKSLKRAKEFSWDKTVAKTVAVYKKALSE
jgi:glycosyltransferase involved in cell wall biosynthesis